MTLGLRKTRTHRQIKFMICKYRYYYLWIYMYFEIISYFWDTLCIFKFCFKVLTWKCKILGNLFLMFTRNVLTLVWYFFLLRVLQSHNNKNLLWKSEIRLLLNLSYYTHFHQMIWKKHHWLFVKWSCHFLKQF